MIDLLLNRNSYVQINDTSRDLTRWHLVCRNVEACGKAVERNDNFCRNCGTPFPASVPAGSPDTRFTVIPSTHGMCYPSVFRGHSWMTALEKAVVEAESKTS